MATTALLDIAITTAVTAQLGPSLFLQRTPESLALFATFAYGSGGTTAKAWVQTSLDGGVSWTDVASFAFTTSAMSRAYHLTSAAVTTIATPTDGSLADNTAVNGVLGHQYRVKYTTTGTYAGVTTLKIWATNR